MRQAIAILFYNKPTLTKQCVKALADAQKYAGTFDERIYLVDNGSSKGVLSEIENDAIKLGIQNLTSIYIPQNKGFSGGMNTALKTAFSDHVCKTATLLSNDVFVKPDFLKALKQRPTLDNEIHCPKVYHAIAKTDLAYQYGSLCLDSFVLSHSSNDYPKKSIEFPDYYPAAVTVWSKSAYTTLEGFNERFYCYWEDVELSLRAKRYNVRLIPRPDLEVHHLGRGTTRKKQEYSSHFKTGRDILQQLTLKP